MGLWDISGKEIKAIKKIFFALDKLVECEEKRKENLSEREIRDLDLDYRIRIKSLRSGLCNLAPFEVGYDAFRKYIEDEDYLKPLKEVYDENTDLLNSLISSIRLSDKHIRSKRRAIKELEKLVKEVKNEQSMITKLLFSKEINKAAEEVIYEFRDWLINDFDDLIDKIEPARQEYIISRRGDVEAEKVEEFLSDKFEEYHLYSQWVTFRNTCAFVYYPDLKIK